MLCNRLAAASVLAAALATLGCSPALNWREVSLGGSKVMLPCKPDRATRPVTLGARTWTLEMVGCEAGGALFAASRLEVPPAEQSALLEQWYRANMAAMGDATHADVPPVSGRTLAAQGQGMDPDGSAVQGHFLWQAGSNELVLLAVYAPRISSEMVEPFLINLKLP